MKVYFGFNDIRQDGMGSEAMALMRTLKKIGIEVQPVHAWKAIFIPGYVEEFSPIFVTESEEEPLLSQNIGRMVEVLNDSPQNSIFSHFGSPNWACVIPYLRNDIRVVVSVHSITPSALKIATAYKERVSKFVAISWGVEDRLLKCLPSKMGKKVELITNALNPNDYPIKSYMEKDKRTRIVFFGRIEDVTKGCDKIPQIAQRLKDRGLDFEWDFYGYFHWGYENRFYDLNKRYHVDDRIAYKGCLQPHEIASVVRNYDIFVMPSNHEGFGLALIEAMCSGLGCIASRIKNVTDRIVCDGKEGILCDKNDIKGFADAVYRLASDNGLCRQMGKNAHEKVVKEFSTTQQGLKYRNLFTEVTNTSAYKLIHPKTSIDNFVFPEIAKPHILARLLPLSVKRILKRYL